MSSCLLTTCRKRGRVARCMADFQNLVALPLRRTISHAIPSAAALKALAKLGPIVEMGSGSGYWAAMLRERGVDVLAYDAEPPRVDEANNEFASRCFCQVATLPITQQLHSNHTQQSCSNHAAITRSSHAATSQQSRSDHAAVTFARPSRHLTCPAALATTLLPHALPLPSPPPPPAAQPARPPSLPPSQPPHPSRSPIRRLQVLRGDSSLFGTAAVAGRQLHERALLLVWPNQDPLEEDDPTKDPWDLECLQDYYSAGGSVVAYVGERTECIDTLPGAPVDAGTTASKRFQVLLHAKYNLVQQISIPNMLFALDDLTIWRRK